MKVLCYLGPSLDRATAKLLIPDAIIMPPARHADLISHAFQYAPTHILLVDGDFNEHLPVWHKECVFCALMGIKLYGASSMGALRAAELADVGVMIGCGKIFQWYWEGICEADDEVCLRYHKTPNGLYVSDTCPLVNIRAGLDNAVANDSIDQEAARHEFEQQRAVHYGDRLTPSYALDQKRLDAIELLSTFQDLDYHTDIRPDLSWITHRLQAVIERVRRVEHKGAALTLQNIDSYISLHSPEHDQILWDSKNRALALILCDLMNVSLEEGDIDREWSTFCARHGLDTWEMFQEWLKTNALTEPEFMVLSIQNARIRKLHLAYASTKNWSRQTLTVLNYTRTHNTLANWIDDCADTERKLVDDSNDEAFSINLDTPIESLLSEHFNATGLKITGTLEGFLRETGIGGADELRVSLERYQFARNHG